MPDVCGSNDITIELDEDVLARFSAQAEALGLNAESYARELILEYVREDQSEPT